MDPERIAQIEAELANIGELTDERIAELRAELTALLREVAADAPSVERNASLRALDEHLQALDAAAAERAEGQAELEAEAAEILERVLGEDEDETDDEAEVEGETDAEVEPVEETGDEEAAVEPEPVTAAALPSLGEIAARRPARQAPRPASEPRGPRLRVASEGMDHALGSEFSSWDEVVRAFQRRHDDIAMSAANSGEFARVVSMQTRQERPSVSPENSPEANSEIVARAFGVSDLNEFVNNPEAMRAITASGGLCAPVDNYYGQAHIGDAGRPVAASLPTFDASRGGIRFVPPVRLSDITADTSNAAITTVTAAQDAASKAKTKQTVTCPAIQEVDFTAIAYRLGFGNVGARTFPERVANIISVTMDAVARVAERRLLTQIGAGSTVVSTAAVYGATRDILGNIGRAAAGYRNRHRMPTTAPLRVILPAWALDAMVADLANNPNGDGLEHFAVAQSQIEAWLRARSVNVTWARDGEIAKGLGVAQDYAAQSGLSAALVDFPDNMVWYLFHEGAWLHLDGGTLDLGLVRDSTLNSTNDYEVMAEFFEDVAFVGVESLKVISPICASGAQPTGATVGACASKVGFGS